MTYFHILLSVGLVVVAAVSAIYSSMPDRSQQRPHTDRRRHHNDNHQHDNNRTGSGNKQRRAPKSKPGDKCILCLKVMKAETMRSMVCGHAMCSTPCYTEYRKWRRECPFCDQIVFRFSQPGDDCCICSEPMVEDGQMQYLKCEHALHTSCLQEYKRNGFKICPLCKDSLQ